MSDSNNENQPEAGAQAGTKASKKAAPRKRAPRKRKPQDAAVAATAESAGAAVVSEAIGLQPAVSESAASEPTATEPAATQPVVAKPAAVESTVAVAPAPAAQPAAPQTAQPATQSAANAPRSKQQRRERHRSEQAQRAEAPRPQPQAAPQPAPAQLVENSAVAHTALIRVPLSVRWRDLDAFNHVNNSKFLSYLEEARLRWMVTLPGHGMDEHVAPVVAAAHLNYRRPIEWPNEIDVELFVERLGNTSLSVGHRIVGADDPSALYCDGNVVMVWIHRETGQPAALPEPVRAACTPR
ncbi:acyl-CoA thioester hydrolase, YbgC/YbaW family [Lysobacter enzymogenes]|nr:acyl-CoA thioester hydrolase, YbgC/YbaW family [Lysobacter enzymogenes]